MTDMSNDILGMMVIGIAALAVGWSLRHMMRKAGRALPGWFLPAIIGGSMFFYTVWNEYTWYHRVTGQLPESVVVLGTGEGGKAWRPWTFVLPMVTRFSALNRADLRAGPEGTVEAPVLLVERWQPTRMVMTRFDCTVGRMAGVAANGAVTEWSDPAPDDPAVKAACGG